MALTRTVTDFKDSVKAATTTDITLTGGAPNTVDGVSLSVGDSVLVKAQNTPSQNGIYRVITVGTGSNGTWARRSDFNASNQITSGALIFVERGTLSGNVFYYLAGGLGTVTVGSTSLTFSNLYSFISTEIGQEILTTYLPTYVGNISAGNLTASTGIYSSSYYFANGDPFTSSSYGNTEVGAYLTAYTGNVSAGNVNASTGIYSSSYYFANGDPFTSSNYGNTEVGAYLTTYSGNLSAGNLTVTGNIIVTDYEFVNTTEYANLQTAKTVNAETIGNTGATLVGNVNGVIWGPMNGTIGATIANTGAFTTITASSTLGVTGTANFAGTVNAATLQASAIGNTGATITGTHNGPLNGPHNGTVGATTPNTGAFTTLTTTSTANVGNLITNGGVFWANGSPYSSGGGGGVTYTASATAPSSPSEGDQWYETDTDILYTYVNDGSSTFWLDISSFPDTGGNINPAVYLGQATISTTATLIDTLPVAGNTLIRWSATANDTVNSRYKASSVDSINDGSSVYYNEYSVIKSDPSYNVVVLTSNISAGNINLYGVGDSATVNVTFERLVLGSATNTGYLTKLGPKGDKGDTGSVASTSGYIITTNTDPSTSTTTGALQVAGGAGIDGNVYIGGYANIANTITVTGSILPSANVTYDLGSSNLRWNNLWVSATTIYMGTLALKDDTGTFSIYSGTSNDLVNVKTAAINETPIGNATASTGAFTTLSASSTLNVTGTSNFAGTLNAATMQASTIGNTGASFIGTHNGPLNGPLNGTVGATTANTGAFTTITSSSTIVASGNILAKSGTASTSQTTGALVVSGGIGANGTANIGNVITSSGVYWANGSAFSPGVTTGKAIAMAIVFGG